MQFTIKMPDDCHAHLRNDEMMRMVVPYSERQFNRVVVMPNTTPPLTTRNLVIDYSQQLRDLNVSFSPMMTLYLTDDTNIEDLEALSNDPCFAGCKLYPVGATVNSKHGVTSIEKIKWILAHMQRLDIPLLIHGEDTRYGIFEREEAFIRNYLFNLCADYPKLRVVLEHITTAYAASLIKNNIIQNLWATITPHHLLISRDSIFANNMINPHYFCLPIAKKESDRKALLEAATSGNSRFFAGTDSAPHPRSKKEEQGVPGCFTAPAAIEHYAEAFDSVDKLDRLEGFTSIYGAKFYGWETTLKQLTLYDASGDDTYDSWYMMIRKHRHDFHFSADIPYPFSCGRYLKWRIKNACA